MVALNSLRMIRKRNEEVKIQTQKHLKTQARCLQTNERKFEEMVYIYMHRRVTTEKNNNSQMYGEKIIEKIITWNWNSWYYLPIIFSQVYSITLAVIESYMPCVRHACWELPNNARWSCLESHSIQWWIPKNSFFCGKVIMMVELDLSVRKRIEEVKKQTQKHQKQRQDVWKRTREKFVKWCMLRYMLNRFTTEKTTIRKKWRD